MGFHRQMFREGPSWPLMRGQLIQTLVERLKLQRLAQRNRGRITCVQEEMQISQPPRWAQIQQDAGGVRQLEHPNGGSPTVTLQETQTPHFKDLDPPQGPPSNPAQLQTRRLLTHTDGAPEKRRQTSGWTWRAS